jgi:hypothetical protein
MMDLSWLWYGFLVIVCMFLMLVVMWITDRAIEYANKVWDRVFNSLNKPF